MIEKENTKQQQILHSIDNLRIDQIEAQNSSEQCQKKLAQQTISPAGICQIFREADVFDKLLIVIGTISALIVGASLPLFAFLWGQSTDAFGKGGDQMVQAALDSFIQFTYIGGGIFIIAMIASSSWSVSSQRQAITIRKDFLKSLLRQQIGWFDVNNQNEISAQFSSNAVAFQGAIGQNFGNAIMATGTIIAAFIIGFVKGWLLTLIFIGIFPFIGITGALFARAVLIGKTTKQNNYNEAGGLVQQAIAAIRTVKMLNGQKYEADNYEQSMRKTQKTALMVLILVSFTLGLMMLIMMCSYALGFWAGSKLIQQKIYNPVSASKIYTAGDVIVIFFSIVIAGRNIGDLMPSLRKISEGRLAAKKLFNIIDRQPEILNSPNAIIPQNFKGIIQFENVTFSYPKQKNRIILDNISFKIDLAKTALVGQSGCGKSTILQLLLRFYDPNQGVIKMDGIDLKQIDLGWLRDTIGYVGQQPVLFATSIRQNMSFGRGNATQSEIIEALKQAQAYDFIMQLDDKLDTFVGTGGGQLSGGQKQRIAIARALLKNPKILLLDQATSALDRLNEKKIQKTFDKISEKLKTITVAHRVKTIINSDMIFVLDKGKILQKGKFNELQRYDHHIIQNEQEEQVIGNSVQKLSSINNRQNGKVKIISPHLQNNKQQKFQQSVQLTNQQKLKQQQAQIASNYWKINIFARLFCLAINQILYLIIFILAIIFTIGNGVIMPLFAMNMATYITILIKLQNNAEKGKDNSDNRDDADYYAIVFVILAAANFIGTFMRSFLFGILGGKITFGIRTAVFSKILKMPIPWFDIPRNNAGSLASRLSSDCDQVLGLTTVFLSILLQITSTLISALIIAFVFEWRTALVALGILPLISIAGIAQAKAKAGTGQTTQKAYSDAVILVSESVLNIRTVTSFGYDRFVMQQYSKRLDQPRSIAIKGALIGSFFFGLGKLIMFFCFGILFYLGAVFVRNYYQDLYDGTNRMFTALYGLLFAGIIIGNNLSNMPEFALGYNAAANLFFIIDSKDQDQLQIQSNSKQLKTGIQGNILLNNIGFKYESRDQELFKNLNLQIKDGEKVAFVGASGCGKSTIMQLLLRFYDVKSGEILINGKNIQDYDIHYLRSCFGVVSQEPVLFNTSFKNNIRYNIEATDLQIQEAARKANALSFIVGEEKINDYQTEQTAGKSGFDRGVGVKGSHISGGQKQRVAIARAILRNPKILLLDQATSALDSTNEQIVQLSLDTMMAGKTTISIAHRIQTVKNSDKIYVFERGLIVQTGKYEDLVAQKGKFYRLQKGIEFV